MITATHKLAASFFCFLHCVWTTINTQFSNMIRWTLWNTHLIICNLFVERTLGYWLQAVKGRLIKDVWSALRNTLATLIECCAWALFHTLSILNQLIRITSWNAHSSPSVNSVIMARIYICYTLPYIIINLWNTGTNTVPLFINKLIL